MPDFDVDFGEGRYQRIVGGGGADVAFRSRHRRRDGSLFPVEVRCRVCDAEGGGLVVAIARDISEQEALELALRRSKEEYAALLRNLPGATYSYVVGAAPEPSWISERVQRLTGYGADAFRFRQP
ncbi:MAG: PAS domain S-box protein, partial [Dehalococcoidia bacterium]|nr:PAS domain S-box protein [Dehalococcoidia bacterium]